MKRCHNLRSPFTINNNSEFNDNELYVAIVGEDLDDTKGHVWIDPVTNTTYPMSRTFNTVPGPVYNNDKGPGDNALYAACFFKLSDIPQRTFNLPPIKGCRIYISVKSQLYFYFFGATGKETGYTAPNKKNIGDPNQGIMFEIIELTNDQYGFFGNTSRVDAFQYPMGLELLGYDGYYKRVGDLKTKAEVVSIFRSNVPAQFHGCVTPGGEIWAPAKTTEFDKDGIYAHYFDNYINAIWEKYKHEDLIFYAGKAGTFKGRVNGERLECREIAGGFDGRTATVVSRPSTQEAFEGKGVLDSAVTEATGKVDRVVQAQLTAAINRHMVDITTPNVGLQNWYNVSSYYQAEPMNHYARFWHLPGLEIDQLAYGFAYDDVAEQSSSLHTSSPYKAIVTFGGYAGISCRNATVTPYAAVGNNAMQQTSAVSLGDGETVKFSPQSSISGGTWNWVGPEGFASTNRETSVTYNNPLQTGSYVAFYKDDAGCYTATTFKLTSPCAGTGPVATGQTKPDYVWSTTGSNNPVITFIPGKPITGSTMVIMYYKIGTGAGNYAGARMDPSGSNFTKSITVPSGTQVSIYFTYRVGTTLTERTSLETPHEFTVGQCSGGDNNSTNTSPVVSLTSPLAGAIFTNPANITITAQASDSDGTIAKVEFYDGSVKLGESISTPYTYTWTNASTGSHSITAKATDDKGAATSSSPTTITVNDSGNVGGCQGAAINGDFTYKVFTTSSTVNWTFIPGTPIAGSTLCIIYINAGTGYAGYPMTASGSNFTFNKNYSAGTNLQFYFTYRIGTTNAERNSMLDPKQYAVGTSCTGRETAFAQKNKNTEHSLIIYPNPVNNELTFSHAADDIFNVSIADQTGKEILKSTSGTKTFDVSSLPPGMYIISVSDKNGIGKQRFVKK